MEVPELRYIEQERERNFQAKANEKTRLSIRRLAFSKLNIIATSNPILSPEDSPYDP